jgi:crotonobetainyl-CoA:carnitine CoA-transferase CaiB-like acyl-CoA transferase
METIYGGLKVLELADQPGGMLCGKMLAAYGADVLKIEQPGGDSCRRRGPFYHGEREVEKSLSFAFLNLGKRDITLDLRSEQGRNIFLRLADNADVIIETNAPGQLAEWGLDYAALTKRNPGLIMASITPFGQNGPHSSWRAASDLIVDAMGGPMPEVGMKDQPPLHLGHDLLASAAGMYALFAIQAAYHRRLTSNGGAYIDISMQECFIAWRSQALGFAQLLGEDMEFPGGPGYVRQGLIQCKDGFAFCMIGGKWNELLAWFSDLGLDVSVFDDPKYQEHIYEVLTLWDKPLQEYFDKLGAFYTKEEIMLEGQRRRIPVGAMETGDSLLGNEQFAARGFFIEIEHPVLGRLQYTGSPVIMTESPLILNRPAPLLGANNEEVYHSIGLAKQEIEQLRAAGVI